MPVKINNTYLIEKIDDIPINDMKIGRQLMLIEPLQDSESQMIIDKVTNMTLEKIDMDILYNFIAISNKPMIRIDNDKFGNKLDELGEDVVDNMSTEEYSQLAVESYTDRIAYYINNKTYTKDLKKI